MEINRGDYIEIRWDKYLTDDGYVLFVVKTHNSGYVFKVIQVPKLWHITQQRNDMLFWTKTDWDDMTEGAQVSKIDRETLRMLYDV